MEPLRLFYNKPQRFYFLLSLFFLFSFNIFFHYLSYKDFIKDEIIQTKATILNIYFKPNYNVVKLSTENYTFFTSIPKETPLQQLQQIELFLITQKVSFYQYLKGFYTKSFHHKKLDQTSSLKTSLNSTIKNQHDDTNIASLYNALFLATNISPTLREFTTNYGIAHLVAISGFHIGIASALLYFILNILYNVGYNKKPNCTRTNPTQNLVQRHNIFLVFLSIFSMLDFVNFRPKKEL